MVSLAQFSVVATKWIDCSIPLGRNPVVLFHPSSERQISNCIAVLIGQKRRRPQRPNSSPLPTFLIFIFHIDLRPQKRQYEETDSLQLCDIPPPHPTNTQHPQSINNTQKCGPTGRILIPPLPSNPLHLLPPRLLRLLTLLLQPQRRHLIRTRAI